MPEFQEYAKKHLIMLELDYPKQKELPAKLKEQNDKLAQEFKVEGFPTVLLMNSKGREIKRTGYQEGGPGKYVEHLKERAKAPPASALESRSTDMTFTPFPFRAPSCFGTISEPGKHRGTTENRARRTFTSP